MTGRLSLYLTVACLASGALSSSLFSPCKKTDLNCIETVVKNALPQIINGIPELGIEASDPLFLEVAQANLPTINYKISNSTVVGFKTCSISNLKINADLTRSQCEIKCKELKVDGQYEVKGSLFSLPVEGKGDYTFKSGEYLVTIDTGIELVPGSDGKTHVALKDFKVDPKPIGVAVFDLKNLFDGQEELASAVKKFAEEHWREVTELVQGPIWNVILEKIIGNINKYLGSLAVEDILLN